jgi:hypothetical protein
MDEWEKRDRLLDEYHQRLRSGENPSQQEYIDRYSGQNKDEFREYFESIKRCATTP